MLAIQGSIFTEKTALQLNSELEGWWVDLWILVSAKVQILQDLRLLTWCFGLTIYSLIIGHLVREHKQNFLYQNHPFTAVQACQHALQWAVLKNEKF